MAMTAQSPTEVDEYSPSSTLIPFDHPLPLLRGPIHAGPSDDPSAGPFVLAFKDPQCWASAYRACETQIIQQCENGARIGCSISASNKCKPPWWQTLIGAPKQDLAERAKCEEREMAVCVEAAKEKCREFACQKCFPVFKDARIAATDRAPSVNWKKISKLVSLAALSGKMLEIELLGIESSWIAFKLQLEETNYRGRDLLVADAKITDFERRKEDPSDI